MLPLRSNQLIGVDLMPMVIPLLKIHTLASFGILSEKYIANKFAFSSSSLHPGFHIPSWLEKIAWMNFLQSTLSLGIWSTNTAEQTENPNTITKNIIPMILAFIFGSIGTFLGAIISYSIVSNFIPKDLLEVTKICCGCLSASYIGGTANFFEVGYILNKKYQNSSKLLNIVAGADIAIMCLFFAILSAIQSSNASTYMMSLFYATVGLNTNAQQLLELGGPMMLMISFILTIHLLITFGGSYIWNNNMWFVRSMSTYSEKSIQNTQKSDLCIDLDTAVLASNACVGGASTAAAMAASIGRTDLALSATSAGILGSVIGTQAGLLLHKTLSKF
eukprot:gene3286-6510_t